VIIVKVDNAIKTKIVVGTIKELESYLKLIKLLNLNLDNIFLKLESIILLIHPFCDC